MNQLPTTSRLYCLHERVKFLRDDMKTEVSNRQKFGYAPLWRVERWAETLAKIADEIEEIGKGGK